MKQHHLTGYGVSRRAQRGAAGPRPPETHSLQMRIRACPPRFPRSLEQPLLLLGLRPPLSVDDPWPCTLPPPAPPAQALLPDGACLGRPRPGDSVPSRVSTLLPLPRWLSPCLSSWLPPHAPSAVTWVLPSLAYYFIPAQSPCSASHPTTRA